MIACYKLLEDTSLLCRGQYMTYETLQKVWKINGPVRFKEAELPEDEAFLLVHPVEIEDPAQWAEVMPEKSDLFH